MCRMTDSNKHFILQMSQNLEKLKFAKKECNIGYIFNKKLLKLSNGNPIIKNRAKLVHSLIKSYDLLDHLTIIASKESSYSELRSFHSEDYCNVLKHFPEDNIEISNESLQSECSDHCSDNELTADDKLSEYGLGFDCPIWSGLYNYCKEIAGSTITACKELINGRKIVINWFGGWHHAQRSQAAGYCYVNDIVLGILKLREYFDKVLYIDLDVHYGDGVADAFETTKKVLTLSFHQFEPGFYPGSGNVNENGFGNAKGYSVNFPYKSGLRGELFNKYSTELIKRVHDDFKPNVIVVQCGADCIAGDPLGNSNLVPEDMEKCIRLIVDFNLPTLFLGGGGYNISNTSRYWTYITSVICGVPLSSDIPDEDEYFLEYSPGYELSIQIKNIKDMNTTQHLDEVMNKINGQLDETIKAIK